MITKKIALIAMMGSILQPIVAQEAQQQLCKKEIAIKIAKITGYSLEALLAFTTCFSFKKHLLDTFQQNIKELKEGGIHRLNLEKIPVYGIILNSMLLFGHSLKGLTAELTPVVKIAIQRIKKEKPTHQIKALFNNLKCKIDV